jgi:hypothetical protein
VSFGRFAWLDPWKEYGPGSSRKGQELVEMRAALIAMPEWASDF